MRRVEFSVFIMFLFAAGAAQGQSADSRGDEQYQAVRQQETATNFPLGLYDSLSEIGMELQLGVTNVYQQNVHGGLSTHRRAGRFSGSYDLELSADMEKLAGIENGSVYVLTEGVWSKSAGIDEPAVGSFFGVNGDARDRRAMDVTELWYEHAFLGGACRIRLGKMDLTGGFEHHNCPVAFDCSNFANDETTQFLNNALINNPTIPFPDYGLGVGVHYGPDEVWYVSAAVADAQADIRETGFGTAFHEEDYLFCIFETGITPQLRSINGPLQGAYRLGMWYDPQDKERFSDGRARRDDTGFYLTFDQMLCKENNDPEDGQGFAAFGRYGWASSKVNEVTNFFSAGFQYQGLLPERDLDVLALGFARGVFSDEAATFTDDYESVWELYYSARLSGSLAVSPSIQYVHNPGADGAAADALVMGARLQMNF